MRLILGKKTNSVIVGVPVEIQQDFDIELSKRLKKQGFVENLIIYNGTKQLAWTRKFCIVVILNDSVLIGNKINGVPMKLTNVQNHIKTIDSFINYFDR